MQLRCIFATFESPILEEIEAFRKRYDPIWNQVPAHITLVHPFQSDLSNDELIRHLEANLKLSAVRFSFGPSRFEESCLFLPVLEGANDFRFARDHLCSGQLTQMRSESHDYVPHVTIGKFGSQLDRSGMSSEAERVFTGRIARVNRVVLEAIGRDESSQVIWQRDLV